MKLVSIKKERTMIFAHLTYVLLDVFQRFVLWLLVEEDE